MFPKNLLWCGGDCVPLPHPKDEHPPGQAIPVGQHCLQLAVQGVLGKRGQRFRKVLRAAGPHGTISLNHFERF